MIRRLLWIVYIFAAAALFFYTRTAVSLFLLSASVFLPAAALLLAALAAGKVRVSLRVPADLRKGESARCTLCLESSTIIPAACVVMTLSVTNTLTGAEEKIPLGFSAAPREKREMELAFTSACCGQYLFTCTEMRVYDFLGLRGVRKPVDIREKRTVPPELFSPRVTLSGAESPPGGGETFPVPFKGQDKTEPFQIREYAEGDSLKQIHWKLTQKLGRYIVMDPSLELEVALLMLWDGAPLPAGTPPYVPDALAEAFVSVCIELAEEGVPFSVAWRDGESGEAVFKDVSTMDDVYDVVPGILSVNEGGGLPLIPALSQKLDEKKYPLIAYFSYQSPEERIPAGKLTNFMCKPEGAVPDAGEEGGILFTPSNYQSVLRTVLIG